VGRREEVAIVADEREKRIAEALARHDLPLALDLARQYRASAGARPEKDLAGSAWFRSHYLAAQAALAANLLGEVWECLRPLVANTAGLLPGLVCHLRLMTAEAQARLHGADEARQQLKHLARLRSTIESDPALWLRELRVRLVLKEVRLLEHGLGRCRQALEAAGQRENLILLWTEEGRAWDDEDELDRAAACWEQAARLLQGANGRRSTQGANAPRSPIQADLLMQMGRLEHLRGRLQAALDRYHEAKKLAALSPAHQMNIQLRILLILVELNQLDQARTGWLELMSSHDQAHPLQRVGSLPEEVRDLAHLIGGLLDVSPPWPAEDETAAWRAMHRHDLTTARRLYHRALSSAPSGVRQARLTLALGLLSLAARVETEALLWLKEAERQARALNLPEVLWRALQARGQLALAGTGGEREAQPLLEESARVLSRQAALLVNPFHRASYRRFGASFLQQRLLAACRRGDVESVFRDLELLRGRLLLELSATQMQAADQTIGTPRLRQVSQELFELERRLDAGIGPPPEPLLEQYVLRMEEREQLWMAYFCDPGRPAGPAMPPEPHLRQLQRALRPGEVFVAPHLEGEELYLLAVRRSKCQVLAGASSIQAVRRNLDEWHREVAEQLEALTWGKWPETAERAVLDGLLARLGEGPLGQALFAALAGGCRRLLWAPAGLLHGFPIHALRVGERYLIEEHEVQHLFSAAHYLWQRRQKRRHGGRRQRLLLVTQGGPEVDPVHGLRYTVVEGQGVAAAFDQRTILHDRLATREAVRPRLPAVDVFHVACHATFAPGQPLTARLEMPSGEAWTAAEWLREPLRGLPLVTLSACRSLQVGRLIGDEVFGLVAGFLGGGARAVLGGLWPVVDRPAVDLMWRFYRHLMLADPVTALAQAQREMLGTPAATPLYWAVFALFGDPGGLPAPGWLARRRARRRQRRHEMAFSSQARRASKGTGL
jgi:tetratricopeptide (TPR) repeat protein